MPENYAIGIDLGGTNVRAALVAEDGSILKRVKEPTTPDVFETLERAVRQVMDDRAKGIGIGCAGLIDRASGRVLVSPNIHTLDGRGFEGLGGGLPVILENDASAAALGERWLGAGRQYGNFVLLTLGTGIGGGIIHNGRLLNVSAEVGHMSIEQGGAKCPCGNYGCLESYASARAITSAITKAIESGAESMLKDSLKTNIYKLTPEDIYAAALDGDNLSREALKEAGRYLGVGIANIVNLLSPEAVILGGGLAAMWDIYINEAIRETSRRAFPSLFEATSIVAASMGDDAGVLGAAYLVLNGEKADICRV